MRIPVNIVVLIFFMLSIFFSCATNNNNVPYLARFDFDGDGVNDRIDYTFSGGAHCCYTISLFLTSSGVSCEFPFSIDGGYMTGLDDSNPDAFNIADYDGDGLPEIFLKINTYNDELLDIPREWREKYHIHSHHILIDYNKNEILVKDHIPGPNPVE